jgi:hypothetical protein
VGELLSCSGGCGRKKEIFLPSVQKSQFPIYDVTIKTHNPVSGHRELPIQ